MRILRLALVMPLLLACSIARGSDSAAHREGHAIGEIDAGDGDWRRVHGVGRATGRTHSRRRQRSDLPRSEVQRPEASGEVREQARESKGHGHAPARRGNRGRDGAGSDVD